MIKVALVALIVLCLTLGKHSVTDFSSLLLVTFYVGVSAGKYVFQAQLGFTEKFSTAAKGLLLFMPHAIIVWQSGVGMWTIICMAIVFISGIIAHILMTIFSIDFAEAISEFNSEISSKGG